MKWLRKRFFTWLLKNLDYYRLMNEVKGEYRLDVDLERSIKMSADELRNIVDDGVDENVYESLSRASYPTIIEEQRYAESQRIVKGYEKP